MLSFGKHEYMMIECKETKPIILNAFELISHSHGPTFRDFLRHHKFVILMAYSAPLLLVLVG
jgi:hypothetical protein